MTCLIKTQKEQSRASLNLVKIKHRTKTCLIILLLKEDAEQI
jgi:hypothetical protein